MHWCFSDYASVHSQSFFFFFFSVFFFFVSNSCHLVIFYVYARDKILSYLCATYDDDHDAWIESHRGEKKSTEYSTICRFNRRFSIDCDNDDDYYDDNADEVKVGAASALLGTILFIYALA